MNDPLGNRPLSNSDLYVILGLITLVVLPHTSNVDIWVSVFFIGVILFRLATIWRPRLMPNKWLIVVMVILAISNVILNTNITDMRLAGTALLVAMLGLKVVEIKTRREIYIAIFLCYFVILTHFLYQQDLWLAIYLFSLLIFLNSILISLNRVNFNLRQLFIGSAKLSVAAVPITIALFIVFPRLNSPLWSIDIDKNIATTGISDNMSLGSISELSQSNATAFRVDFLNKIPKPENRYWRGTLLWKTDGINWTSGNESKENISPATVSETAQIEYRVTLEANNQPWIFALDHVSQIPSAAILNSGFELNSDKPITERQSYRLSSNTAYFQTKISHLDYQRALQLPDYVSSRVRDLALKWKKQSSANKPVEIIDAALAHFNTESFIYSLKPGLLGKHPIDAFLFKTKKGFCEHYAASFTLLMRIAGIPTRIVLGYQGAEKNPIADHWVVRQSNAHSWTEVWLDDVGWLRVDPTAAVAPERIERSIDLAGSTENGQVLFTIKNQQINNLWQQARWLIDAVDHNWHSLVLDFDSEQQQNIFEVFGLNDLPDIQRGLSLIGILSLVLFLVYLLSLIKLQKKSSPGAYLWLRLKQKLQKRGLTLSDHIGPKDTLALSIKRWPLHKNKLKLVFDHYIQYRYGIKNDKEDEIKLLKMIRKLKLPVSKH